MRSPSECLMGKSLLGRTNQIHGHGLGKQCTRFGNPRERFARPSARIYTSRYIICHVTPRGPRSFEIKPKREQQKRMDYNKTKTLRVCAEPSPGLENKEAQFRHSMCNFASLVFTVRSPSRSSSVGGD